MYLRHREHKLRANLARARQPGRSNSLHHLLSSCRPFPVASRYENTPKSDARAQKPTADGRCLWTKPPVKVPRGIPGSSLFKRQTIMKGDLPEYVFPPRTSCAWLFMNDRGSNRPRVPHSWRKSTRRNGGRCLGMTE